MTKIGRQLPWHIRVDKQEDNAVPLRDAVQLGQQLRLEPPGSLVLAGTSLRRERLYLVYEDDRGGVV